MYVHTGNICMDVQTCANMYLCLIYMYIVYLSVYVYMYVSRVNILNLYIAYV